ncbi:hypothetical protein Tco_0204690 [Tanacetum coccineum]
MLGLTGHFLGEQQALKGRPLDSNLIEKLFVEEFPQWLHNQVSFLEKNKFDKEVSSLAIGPKVIAKQFNGFITNGYRFLTKKREKLKKTQNSGVIVAVEEASGKFMAKAKKELSRKTKAIDGSEPVDHEVEAEIARDIIQKLRPGRVTEHGAGVKKSQVTKFGIEYRRMRGEAISGEKRFLLEKIDFQSKKIEAQSKQIELMSKKNEAQSKKLESQSKQIESLSKNNE